MGFTVDRVRELVLSCMSRCCGGRRNTIVRFVDCKKLLDFRDVLRHRSGVYVFLDPVKEIVYYVGESGDLYERLYREHCRASIGSSEGVVRFMMYLLDKLCREESILRTKDVLEREKIVRDHLRRFIGKLTICIAYCTSGSPDKIVRREAENCLKEKLKPILN